MSLDINKIIFIPLNNGKFFEEEHSKSQILLHHTESGSDGRTVIEGWNMNIDKIGTSFVICGKPKSGETKYKDGDIIQCFPEKFWAYHLGIQSSDFTKYGIKYQSLDKFSIGIKLCNFGYLTKQKDGTFKNYVGGIVPIDEVTDLGSEFRGYQYFHSYTKNQLLSLRELLIYLCDKYNIPKIYNEGMWKINQGALNGTSGIWSHTSFRQEKCDIVPQKSIIDMLKSLKLKPELSL